MTENEKLRIQMARLAGIVKELHSILHPEFNIKDCKHGPCRNFRSEDDYEQFVLGLMETQPKKKHGVLWHWWAGRREGQQP
jgi:hypothetical protein